MSRSERPCQELRVGEESTHPGVTATPYVLPVLHPRLVCDGKQPTRHHYSDSQRGPLRNRARGAEYGNGPLVQADSVPSTGVPSHSGIPLHDLVL